MPRKHFKKGFTGNHGFIVVRALPKSYLRSPKPELLGAVYKAVTPLQSGNRLEWPANVTVDVAT